MEILFKLLADYKCLICQKSGDLLCRGCCLNLMPVILGKELINGLQIYYFYLYKNEVRSIIKRSKFSKKEFSALKSLMKNGCVLYKDTLRQLFVDFICISVPVSKHRLASRGFNQANILAYEFSKNTRIKYIAKGLQRVIDTKHQYTQNKLERSKNIKGAFIADTKTFTGKKVLIIDDVCTTGATLLEAAAVLRAAGAVEVCALALSRGISKV